MAILNVPERGTPIDTQVIYDIVTAVNTLSERITQSTFRTTSLITPDDTRHILTSNARIYCTYVLFNQTGVKAGQSYDFNARFENGNFVAAPVVVATPVHQSSEQSVPDARIVLTAITESGITGKIFFESDKDVNLRINVVAIGAPVGVA